MTVRDKRLLDETDMLRMNLPENLWRVKVQGVQDSVRGQIEHYLLGICNNLTNGRGLLLLGQRGRGKSAIGALIAKEACAWGFTVLFMPIFELREHVRARTMFDDEMSMLDRCLTVDLLVLDDLMQDDQKSTFLSAGDLIRVISSRGSRRRTTIVTTDLAHGALESELANFYTRSQPHLIPLPVVGSDLTALQAQQQRLAALGK